jgi:transcriptional regulator with XRE-family HTH domain
MTPTSDSRLTGRLLKDRREQLGLTQQQLAARLGIHQPAIASLEAGRYPPNIDSLRRVADALDCDLDVQLRPRGSTFRDPDRVALRSRD